MDGMVRNACRLVFFNSDHHLANAFAVLHGGSLQRDTMARIYSISILKKRNKFFKFSTQNVHRAKQHCDSSCWGHGPLAWIIHISHYCKPVLKCIQLSKTCVFICTTFHIYIFTCFKKQEPPLEGGRIFTLLNGCRSNGTPF